MSVGLPDGRFERICAEAGAEPIRLENLPWPEVAALRGVNGGMLSTSIWNYFIGDADSKNT